MNHEQQQQHFARQAQEIQLDAMKEAMAAKRDFDIDEQQRKVDALGQQVRDRLTRLIDMATEIKRDAGLAALAPARYPSGAFGSDTETIDALLVVLSQESSALANMRAAREKNDEMIEKYEGRIDQIQSTVDGAFTEGDAPGARVFALPGPDATGVYM